MYLRIKQFIETIFKQTSLYETYSAARHTFLFVYYITWDIVGLAKLVQPLT